MGKQAYDIWINSTSNYFWKSFSIEVTNKKFFLVRFPFHTGYLILILLLIIFLQVGLAKLNQWYNQQAITYKFVTDRSLTSLIILFDMFENIFKK